MPVTLPTAASNGHAVSLKSNGKAHNNGNGVAKNGHAEPASYASGSGLLNQFINSYNELETYKYVMPQLRRWPGSDSHTACIGAGSPSSWMERRFRFLPLLQQRATVPL